MPSDASLVQQPFRQLRDFRLFIPNQTFADPPWDEASPRVLILRLSTFSDVERSTPHLFLAGEARRGCARGYIDVAFLPRQDDARLMEEAGLPLILGTQSHRPLADFDLVLISNSHILELVNLPFLFSHSGIPLWSSQRKESWPLVILGGSNATAAHAIVNETGDCMVDAIFFGEGEGVVARIVEELPRVSDVPRSARLAKLAKDMDGLWPVGSSNPEIRRARCDVAAASPAPLFQPVLPGPQATTARLSITLGCPCLCSFCYEGHDRRPFREVPADALIEAARKLKMETGAATIELSSFNFNTHSELAKLLVELNRLFLRVNLMSQRVDILARTRGLLQLELAADKHSFTLGIEGISSRLRRVFHKSLADSDIERALEALHAGRAREVKLFYILTGREVENDFAEL
ncbi:MAG TPA: radical SAM protein, partial [Spirochaetia bacterium]|nr:radical SAM protein [Spirochaetia bacterium]